MDRDDHSLSLTMADESALALAQPMALEAQAPRMGVVDSTLLTDKAREWMDAVKWACLNIEKDLGRGKKKRPTCVFWSRQLLEQREFVLSAERLRNRYDAWCKRRVRDLEEGIPEGVAGDGELINSRLCGKPAKRMIPPSVVAAFWASYLDLKDKASVSAAWRITMTRLIHGEEVAKGSGVTWQTVFMREHVADDLPNACPWSIHRPPPGWSLSNFSSLPKPDDVTRALALRGIGAAKALLAKHAGVAIDWSGLRVGECYMIDDHDVDFECWVEGQFVRLRLIVLREVRTRRVLAYVARPRLKEEDGTQRSITRGDVQHLLAGWLFHFGIPRDFECWLHCENAAAAVSAELEEMLLRVTGGRLRIDRTALYKGVVQYGGYAQSGGTPTGKAIIESGFRLLDIELAHIRGATGRNYLYKPEEHQGRINASKRLLKRIQDLPATDQNALSEMVKSGEIKLPFPSIWEAHKEIGLAIQRMDARTWHEMEGFLKVVEFRTAKDAGPFYPITAELLPLLQPSAQEQVKEFFTCYPVELRNRMLSWGRERAESPAECWMRLLPQIKWAKISEAALFELMLDGTTVEYPGHGCVKCEIGGNKVEFRGDVLAQPGQKIRLRFNAHNPFAAWAQDERGRVLGTLRKVERVGYHDAQTMKERAEFKATHLARAVQSVRTLEMQNPQAVDEISDSAYTAALISAMESETARPKAEATIQSETSQQLMSAVESAEVESGPDGGDDAAWEAIYGK